MILRSIVPRHFGPFALGTTLQIDPEVTVLTGANDTGKSLALRAIEILCTDKPIESYEVNRYRTGEFSGKWEDDPEIVCTAVFETTEVGLKKKGLPRGTRPGATVTVTRRMATANGTITEIRDGNGLSNPQIQFNNPPTVLKLPLATEVGQEIKLDNLSEAESDFIRLGFGSAFSFEQHTSISPVDRSFRVREAETKLNMKLREVVPVAMPLEFVLLGVPEQPALLAVGLVDKYKGFAPLASRGAGVRRLLNVMGALLRLDPDDGHSIILYDEPETSLHADAQHMLRRLLESLGAHPNIQVVYTTHSPAMINTLRPHTIRVLERKRVKDKAVSEFVNTAFSENYCLVRSSLGISPSDSLLYAPITVIGEGPTEIRCLPFMLRKLTDSGIIDSGVVESLLCQTHMLDGQGSSCEYMCRLAKSQNAAPVVFLDGDKSLDVQQFNEKHPDVPVIVLPRGKEFEDLVPKATYIQAAADVLEDKTGNMTEAAFLQWERAASLRPSVMFSKRVERWLRDEFDKPLPKPLVMQKAIEMADVALIESKPFEQLIQAMQQVSCKL
ncbi:MAG: ATP-dependent nuclease [Pirellulaceae bacterium]